MQSQFTKHDRTKTTPAQWRGNRKRSKAALAQLFQTNFPTGAQLVTLAYDAGGYIPAGIYAVDDIRRCLSFARRHSGPFKYIRIMRQGTHWAIVERADAAAEILAAWSFGPASVEAITAGQLPALLELLPAEPDTPPCARLWSASMQTTRAGR